MRREHGEVRRFSAAVRRTGRQASLGTRLGKMNSAIFILQKLEILCKIIGMKKILLQLFLFLFGLVGVFAQFSSINNYVTRTWSSSDGLPGNSVSDILQSNDGYIYFGTYECLVKFDGSEFQCLNKYTNSDFSFISARSIFEDSNGIMWIGSNDEGIQKISRDSVLQHISTADGLPNNSIRGFVEDRFKNVWVGTAAGIVYITPGGTIVVPETTEDVNLAHVLVNQLYCDTAGRIWMITNEIGGVYVYAGNSFQRYKDLDDYGNFLVTSIAQDKNGNFWFGLNQDGIVKVSNGKVTRIESGTLLDKEPTYNIYCDESGSIWFGSEKGLVLYTEGKFSVYDDNTPIANASINKIMEDREGNIWVATDNGGVGKISLGKFRMNKLNYAVNAICEGKSGEVWIGTDEGLLCYKNDEFISNEVTEFCKNVRIRHIATASNGDVLINCYAKPAMVRATKEGIINWSTDDGLSGNKTRVSIEAKNGDLYCGTTTGLSIITPEGNVKSLSVSDGFDCEYIMCLYEDENGIMWVGTDGGGIYLMKDGKIFRKITTDDGLAGNVIFKIKQDNKGAYWICTGAGISRFMDMNGEINNPSTSLKFFNFNSASGLGSDSIFQMIVDENNYVWMVSNRGISSVDYGTMMDAINGKRQKIDCKFYTQNDGLKSSGANSTALSMIDKYGRIWFTMADGFAIYDPVRSKSSKVNPIVQIVEVKVDDDVYTRFENEIMIPPDAKHIDIKYTGLSYTSSERNRFMYKLEGFDSDFSELTANRTVSFTNLRPGKYTFYVGVQNADGLFSTVPATVVLIQKAYIYQHPWFWVSISAFVIFVIGMIFIINNRNNKRRQLMLETKIQMATVELQMAKDESDRLLQNILPISIAERLKSKGMGDYGTIADRCEDVTVLFSDIVSFTNTTSNHSATEIVEALNDLIKRFDNSAKKMGVEKIKTIGDAYMAACGVPSPNKYHAEIMLKFAMQMYKDLAEYNKTSKIKFRIRIGLNSGPVIAGVIGRNKFIYDIWGDTVNVASRMESNCNSGHIRMTEAVVSRLEAHGYKLSYREEEVDVKGKGLMKTFELPNK